MAMSSRVSSPRSVKLQKRDPEAFLSRLTLVGEGPTKVGFVTEVLQREIRRTCSTLGFASATSGNTFTLELLEEFTKGRLGLAAFVDCRATTPRAGAI